MPPQSRTQIDVIQALRGIAAMLVVLFHIRGVINGPAYLKIGDRLFASGACGVDLFFLISGFIMVHVTATSACTPRDIGLFLVKRWGRIWPPYMIAMVLFVLCDRAQPLDANTGIAFMKASVFQPMTTDYAPFYGYPPLGVGWTLVYEIWFYVLFAVSMCFRRLRWWALGALFTFVLLAVPFALGRPFTLEAYGGRNFHPALLNVITNPMMWEFAIGGIIAAIYRSRFRIEDALLVRVLVATTVTVFAWQFFANTGRHGPTHWAVTSAPMLLALLLAHKRMPLRIPGWLVWLGDVSFSLYLVHRISQFGLGYLLDTIHLRSWEVGAPFVLATTSFALIGAALSHRYLERGLSEWVTRKLTAPLLRHGPARP